MMRVVFAVPPSDMTATYCSVNKLSRGYLPPLGVGYLAAVAEDRGHHAMIVDATTSGLDIAATVAHLLAQRPDLVGISCLSTITSGIAYELAAMLREQAPGLTIVAGGPHVTTFGVRVLEDCPSFSAVLPGEAEIGFGQLLDALSSGESMENVQGCIWRENGVIKDNGNPAHVRQLDTIPFPAHHLYEKEQYLPYMYLRLHDEPATSVVTSRGCAWDRCKFCFRGGSHPSPYRRRSPENVIEEIRLLVTQRGIRNIKFLDDNFCIGEKWVLQFCDLLEQAKLDIRWAVLARVDTVTPTMLRRIASAGCRSVQFGLESGVQTLLDQMDKGITLDASRQAVRWAREAGLSVMGVFILGLPDETPEMSDRTIEFACELNVDYMFFFPYWAAPETELGRLALERGTQAGPVTRLTLQNPTYVPNTYHSAEHLAEKLRYAYRRYYFRPAYWMLALRNLAKDPSLIISYSNGFYHWLSVVIWHTLSGLRSPRKGDSDPDTSSPRFERRGKQTQS